VVADSRSPRDGRFIEAIGHYDPLAEPVKVEIDGEKVKTWMANGARPTDAARSLLEQAGVIARGGRRAIPLRTKRNPEKAAARVEAKAKKAAAPAASTEATETAHAEPAAAEAQETEAPAAEATETAETAETEAPAAEASAAETSAGESEETPAAETDAGDTKAEDESGS